MSEPVDLPGYRFLGWGPRATGAEPGWNMAHDMFGRCGHCGGMLRLWPEDSVQCSCGRLAMDVDVGRFGSSDGDAHRVDDDGVIRKGKPSQWPSIRRGHALSAAKALGSR